MNRSREFPNDKAADMDEAAVEIGVKNMRAGRAPEPEPRELEPTPAPIEPLTEDEHLRRLALLDARSWVP